MAATVQGAVTVPRELAVADIKSKTKLGVSPIVSLIAGGVAGGVEATVTYPFEFAKTRAQLHQNQGILRSSNPFAATAQVIRNDGLRAVYTGCSTLVLGTAFKAGVRFLSFDSIKRALADSDGKLSPGRGILAGMVAGCVESVVAVTPTERLKTALIDDARSPGARRYTSGTHALRSILATHGLRELYRGLLSTTLKQSATSAVRMGSYNILKEATSSRLGKGTNSAVTFGIGAAAGVITVYATQPFDTIKTRAQAANGLSTLDAARSVARDGGLLAFWSGSTMRLGSFTPAGAKNNTHSGSGQITTYETMFDKAVPDATALISPGVQVATPQHGFQPTTLFVAQTRGRPANVHGKQMPTCHGCELGKSISYIGLWTIRVS
ncbi:CtIP- endonuclease [Lecanicillium sp. MT-2017a]|nr:CtIP- endonuclease [Lecanicillium sp. MT-2017a]